MTDRKDIDKKIAPEISEEKVTVDLANDPELRKAHLADLQAEFGFDDNSTVTAQELAEMGGRKLVYIRPVLAGDVSEYLMDDDGYVSYDLDDDATLYSVHAADGERIALVGDLELAFAAARQQEMNPVNVH